MSILHFCSPTRVIMGENALEELGKEAHALGKRALIVTDAGVRQTGLLDMITAALEKSQIAYFIYDGVVSNPTIANVEQGLNALKQNECDFLIAVGGGSPIDTAKAVSIVATNGGTVRDYEGLDKFTTHPLSMITVPTTVGTGSEVTFGSVISDHERNVKMVIASRRINPVVAFLDPRMVSGLPGPVCAATGMDALTHALEGYVAIGATPMTDALNLHAIRLIGRFLRPAVAGDKAALYQMSIASCLAGIGFHNSGLGLVHALANTAGGYFPIHHGIANSIILPHVMEFNLIARPGKFAEIAAALGEHIEGISEREAAGRAVKAVRQLMKDVGLPTKLAEVGVKEEAIPQMAEDCLIQWDRAGNPRRNSVKDIEMLYRAAL